MGNPILWLALLVTLLLLASLAVKIRKNSRTAPGQFASDAPHVVSNAVPEASLSVDRRGTIDQFPYLKKKYLLSRAERSFYEVLGEAAGEEMVLFTKVRLCDLVYLPPATSERQLHMNKVIQKHVDFVLCSRQTISPILAVELDDSSHRAENRQERDLFLNELFRTIGLPLLRVPARTSYDPNESAGLIRESVLSTATPPP